MADRYWRGGTGNWDASNTANWSTTSGGAGGASVPTSADNVFFNGSSGAGTCTVTAAANCLSLNMTGYTGTFAGTSNVSVFDDLTLSASGSLTFSGNFVLSGTLAATINTNGKTIPGSITSNKTSGSCTLNSAVTCNGTFQANRTLNINGFVLTCSFFSYDSTATSLTWGTTPGKIVVSRSAAGNALITTGSGIATDGRVEVLSPPSGVTINLVSETTVSTPSTHLNVDCVFSGTGSINGQSFRGWNVSLGAGNFILAGSISAVRTFTINSGYTGSFTGSVGLVSIDTTGVTANFNGKTVGGIGCSTFPSAAFGGGAWPQIINSNVTTGGVFSWSGGECTLGTNATVTADNFNISGINPTGNNSKFIFGTGSKIRLTKSTSGTIFNIGSGGGAAFYTRTAPITNNTPIEIPTPASGVTFNIIVAPNRDTSKSKAFGFKFYNVGSGGTVEVGHTFTGTSLDISLGALELSDTTMTIRKISFQANSLYISGNYNGGGNNIANQLSGATLDGLSNQNIGGGGPNSGMALYLDNINGVTCTSNTFCTQLVFGDATIGGGQGQLNLGSFTLTATSFGSVPSSGAININFGTGKIYLNNTVASSAQLLQMNDPTYVGTLLGSKVIEVSPFGTIGDLFTRSATWNASDLNDRIDLRIVANGSTGRIQIEGTVGANLTLGAGSYTFAAGPSPTDMSLLGDLIVQGNTIVYSINQITFDSNLNTSTIYSNGNTIGTRLLTGVNKTVALGDALSCSGFWPVGSGSTLSLGSYNLTTSDLFTSGTGTRTIDFGTGSIIINQGGTWSSANSSNLSFAGTSRNLIGVVGSTGASFTFSSSPSEALGLDIGITVVGSGGTVGIGNFCRNLTIPAGTYTIFRGATYTIYGDLTVNGAVTSYTGGATSLTFAKSSGTQTINTNGNVFGGTGPITFGQASTTLTLGGNSEFAATIFNFNNGTLSLNDFRLTVPSFNSSNSTARTIAFGTSGTIRVTGGTNPWDTSTNTNLTVTGTNRFVEPALSLANQTLNFGAPAEANTFDVSVPSTASSTRTLTFTTSNNIRNLTFSNVAYTISGGTSINIFGDLTILGTSPNFLSTTSAWTMAATSGTKTITTNGKSLSFPIIINGVGGTFALGDNLTFDTARGMTLTNGALNIGTRTLSAGTFLSNNSNVRSIIFGTGGLIRLTATGVTNFDTSTSTNLTVSGTDRWIEATLTGAQTFSTGSVTSDSQLFDLRVASSGATNTLQFSGNYRNVLFPNSAYTVSMSGAKTYYGNFTCQGTSVTFSGTAIQTFAARGTQTITSSGETFSFPITIGVSGETGTVQLADALNIGSNVLTLTLATFNAAGYNVTAGSFVSNNSNTRALTMGNGTWTLSGGATPWDITTATGITLTRGTGSMIFTSASTKTLQCGGLTYPTITQGGAGTMIVAGTNSRFANLTRTHNAAVTITFTSGQTFLFDDFTLTGVSAAARTTLNSTSTSQHTLSKSSGIVSSDFLAISYSNATGGAGWYAGTGSTQGTSVSGWIFTAPPTNSGNMFMLF